MGAGDRGISPAAGRRSGGGRPVKSSVGATGTSAPPPAAHFRLSATGGDTDATRCAGISSRCSRHRDPIPRDVAGRSAPRFFWRPGCPIGSGRQVLRTRVRFCDSEPSTGDETRGREGSTPGQDGTARPAKALAFCRFLARSRPRLDGRTVRAASSARSLSPYLRMTHRCRDRAFGR